MRNGNISSDDGRRACERWAGHNLVGFGEGILSADWKIRAATEKDVNSILAHRRRMFEEMGFTEQTVLDQMVASSRDFIEKGLSNGGYRGFLAITEKNEVVGGAGLAITDWLANPTAPKQSRRAYILNVYTAEHYRRKGIARAL